MSAADPCGTFCSPGWPPGPLPHQRKAQEDLQDTGYEEQPEEARTG